MLGLLSNMEFGITLKSFCSERVKFDIPWIMTLFHQVVTKDALYKVVSTCPSKLAKERLPPFLGYASCLRNWGSQIWICLESFDLSKAYKQLAVLPEHQHHAVVGFP